MVCMAQILNTENKMYIIDKKYSLIDAIKDDNYIDDFQNQDEWCKKCVYYGTVNYDKHWLCSKHFPELQIISFCGHCDKFSKDKKINLLKYGLLKLCGFKFENKAR